jgi:hypothetical protein
MDPRLQLRMHSEAIADPGQTPWCGPSWLWEDGSPRPRLSLDPENVKNGVGQLVLTLVKLLHELLERQAMRRIEAGSLREDQIERIGLTLSRQAEMMEQLRKEFGLEEEDLNLDLGPLGKLL